jgi:hypothetical protein
LRETALGKPSSSTLGPRIEYLLGLHRICHMHCRADICIAFVMSNGEVA